MENITEILVMGQYGVYVWSSFLVAAVIILVMLGLTLRSLRQAQKILRKLQKNEA